MTDAAWETLSNQAVAAAGVLYFLALLAHLVEWPRCARSTGQGPGRTAERGRSRHRPHRRSSEHRLRVAMFGRLGLILTGSPRPPTWSPWSARGMAADPNRVPWGNMYEFTLAGTFVVAALTSAGGRFGLAGWRRS